MHEDDTGISIFLQMAGMRTHSWFMVSRLSLSAGLLVRNLLIWRWKLVPHRGEMQLVGSTTRLLWYKTDYDTGICCFSSIAFTKCSQSNIVVLLLHVCLCNFFACHPFGFWPLMWTACLEKWRSLDCGLELVPFVPISLFFHCLSVLFLRSRKEEGK